MTTVLEPVLAPALAPVPDPGIVVLRRSGAPITVRPAPRREPPFDDELDASAVTGPLDRPLPFEQWRPRLPARLSRPRMPSRTAQPDPALWGRRLIVGIIETAGGKRPLHQLTALLSPTVAAGLGTDFDRAARQGTPHWTSGASVGSVRSTEPADGVAELSATLHSGRRVHAVALRLEMRRGRWCCTRLMLG